LYRTRVYLLSIIIMVVAVACGGDESSSSANPLAISAENTNQTDSSQPVPITDNNSSTTAIASVNGVSIAQVEFDRAFVRIAGNSTAADNSALAIQVLNVLIEQEVIAQASTQLGIAVSDAEIDAEITGLQQGLNGIPWDQWLVNNQYTEDELRAALRNSIITNRVRDTVIAQLDEQIEHVHARHILVKTEAEAQSVLDRLAGGEDFASLATTLSLDVTTRDFGGDLGWFIREELLDVSLADTAFTIEAGQITGPVITRLGYHILQTLEKESRLIEPERMPLLIENVFNRWLEEELLSASIVRNQ
jgi:peptidyl-prolyl cis-trans isomerase C